ncbi:Cytochrome c maturation protein A [Candidatus Bealeia paramacronuclearis]|uniref:Cytochrome c maturation protein A n=1 Tax=Candidatus Bealeia paramacronuclearis TaxID=1921001 RepID=A0ABZ2C1P5_9PROT|nr:Cytochrome c maturation protein A [Candidatus Bealeia paramacronuclearis]
MTMFQIENLTWKDTNGWGFTSLAIALLPGEALILKGANGAGKSTLLRILAGLIPSTIMIPPMLRHYLGHKLGLIENLTVEQNLKIFESLSEDNSKNNIINLWQLEPLLKTKVRHLSQGQKRRVALSRLHFEKRPLWLLDEPMASLDHAMKDLFWEHLNVHLKSGGLAILALHEEAQIECYPQILNLDVKAHDVFQTLAA